MSSKTSKSILGGLLALGLLALLVAAPASAQLSTGNIFVTVNDEDANPLPGVQVTVTGIGAPKVQITNQSGTARILTLDPGAYNVRAELEGFGAVEQPGVTVNANRNTNLQFQLQAAVEETITVTSETPLLDERKVLQGTTVNQTELEKIPTARDPWALLSQTPGVMVDRVNVGGSESGQQSIFRAQGVNSSQNDFQLDGVGFTDMRATGASSTYYDFDQFSEMQFSTGGSDVTKGTAGVQVNLITKRGTNEFRGSARFYNTKAEGYFGGALDASLPDVEGELHPSQTFNAECPRGSGSSVNYCGTRNNEVEDIGFEAGGAVVQDRFWLWGSWGQNDIKLLAASGDEDNTVLENSSLKANAQFSQSNSAVASWNNGDKIKNGRGAGPDRSPASLWDQRGPTALYKAEDTHVFSSNFFLTGTWSHGDTGFQLLARGPGGLPGNGLDPAAPNPVLDANGIWQNNFLSGFASAPTDEVKLDGSYFFNTGGTSHELKIGGRYRTFDSFSDFAWGPNETFDLFPSQPFFYQVSTRGVAGPTDMTYFSLWAQDTMTFGRATLNVGLRFDSQEGENQPVSVAAHPVFPNALPAVSINQAYTDFTWEDIVPRVAFTYALGQDRSTLLRASFSQFADQLGVGTAAWTAPTKEVYAYFDGGIESNLFAAVYFDPLFPSRSPNTVDPGLDAPTTTELVGAVEHSILPELVVGATVTYRDYEDVLDARANLRADSVGGLRPSTRADFVPSTFTGTLASNFANGRSYTGTIWDLVNGNLFDNSPGAFSGGYHLENGARSREYFGYSVNFTKRLSNRWMARGFFNYGDAEWQVPAEWLALNDPTNYRGGGSRDGDLYLERSTGSGKGERFLQSTWSWNLNGLYQIAPDRPWGFNVSGSVNGREGHPIPFYDNVGNYTGAGRTLVVDELDEFRLDDVTTIDLRLEKEFALSSAVNFTFGIDVFNVTNEGTPLSYQTRTDTGSKGRLQDNVSPRIYRLGVRLGWK